jgi:hypothetical protein
MGRCQSSGWPRMRWRSGRRARQAMSSGPGQRLHMSEHGERSTRSSDAASGPANGRHAGRIRRRDGHPRLPGGQKHGVPNLTTVLPDLSTEALQCSLLLSGIQRLDDIEASLGNTECGRPQCGRCSRIFGNFGINLSDTTVIARPPGFKPVQDKLNGIGNHILIIRNGHPHEDRIEASRRQLSPRLQGHAHDSVGFGDA